MKRINRIFFQLTMAGMVMIAASSCSTKLTPLTSDNFSAVPSPLELVGTQVPATVNGKFPEKWFPKKAVVTITPVLKYDGKELLGNSYTYQGEKIAGNGILVINKTGEPFSMKSNFNYESPMRSSELYVRFDATLKGKKVSLPDVKVTNGVLATADLATAAGASPSVAPDAFKRVIDEAHDASIHFLIQQANLRKSELNSTNMDAWKKLVQDAANNDKENVRVEIQAYASPDGGVKLNEGLAEHREKNTSAYLKKDFKTKDIDPEINANYTAQDWDGFKQLLQASNLQDKDLVLRVLSMYSDPAVREREIKNISAVYKDLAETILPQLRRSRLIANVEIIGKSDEEMKNLWNSDKSQLNLEELLYFATLPTSDSKAVYSYVTDKFPNDYRAYNNLANLYLQAGDVSKASDLYAKASSLSSNAAATNANLALLDMDKGDLSDAEQLLGNASGASALSDAMGLLDIKKGNYAKSVEDFGDSKSNNAAVAQILSKDYSSAQRTLNAMSNKDAITSYLSAIVAARTNNMSDLVSNLRSAIKQDSSLANKAASDLEFAKYMTNPDVANALK